MELVAVDDLGGFGGEAVDVVLEILCDVARVGADGGEALIGEVVELQLGRGDQQCVPILAGVRGGAVPHRLTKTRLHGGANVA